MIKVDAHKLLDGPMTVQVEEPPRVLEVDEDPTYEFIEGMTGEIVFSRVMNKVLARGTLHTRVRTRCVRCLDPIELPIESQFTLMFSTDPDLLDETKRMEFPDEVVYYDGHVIEPLQDFRDFLLMELPPYPSCDKMPGKPCGQEQLKQSPVTFGLADGSEEAPTDPWEQSDKEQEPAWKSTIRDLARKRNSNPGQ
jgi:uncharacterized metal-binding protein YceD (DUF177 family)